MSRNTWLGIRAQRGRCNQREERLEGLRPRARAVAVCSPGNVELLKGSCQSLVKIRPLFQAFMGVAVSKMQRER